MSPHERRIDLLREALQDMIELANQYVGPGDSEGQLSIRRAREVMELTTPMAPKPDDAKLSQETSMRLLSNTLARFQPKR